MKSKTLGGILLIVGSTVGGGILALPAATGSAGFFPAAGLMLFCWALMTFCAFLILEINFWLPSNTNLVSMAGATLGSSGKIITWILCLLLLYSLVAAYITAGSHLFSGFLRLSGFHSLQWISPLLFLAIFGCVIYKGIRAIDSVTRCFIVLKLLSYLVIIFFLIPYLNKSYFLYSEPEMLLPTMAVVITAFSFSLILPSLRIYFKSDIHKLRFIVFVSSLITLVCYLLWIFALLGTLPVDGQYGFLEILHAKDSAVSLIDALNGFLNKNIITESAKFFASISIITSFLGASLALSDFLADGFGIEKKGFGNFSIYSLTFIPPVLIALFYPRAFMICLNNAGILCLFLLVILPTLMVWKGRYNQHRISGYQVMGGKSAILVAFFMGVLLIALNLLLQK